MKDPTQQTRVVLLVLIVVVLLVLTLGYMTMNLYSKSESFKRLQKPCCFPEGTLDKTYYDVFNSCINMCRGECTTKSIDRCIGKCRVLALKSQYLAKNREMAARNLKYRTSLSNPNPTEWQCSNY